jgi:hypothetical protein
MTVREALLWHGLEVAANLGATPAESRDAVATEILRRWGILRRRQALSRTMREAVWAEALREADTWVATVHGGHNARLLAA